mgnify:CR=1 FL=1
MKVKVLLFGILSEKAKASDIVFENVSDLNALMDRIRDKYPLIKKMQYIISINRKVVKENKILNDGDEIALLPPFAGG